MNANSSLAILLYENALYPSYWQVEGNEEQARQILKQLAAIQEKTCKPRLWDGFPEPGFTVIDVLTPDTLQDILDGKHAGLITREHFSDFLIPAGHADLLESVVVKARNDLIPTSPGSDAGMHPAWLNTLMIHHSDVLDALARATPENAPGPIVWVEVSGLTRFTWMPSDAFVRLVRLARAAGLSTQDTEEAEAFCARHGNELDALLATIQASEGPQ